MTVVTQIAILSLLATAASSHHLNLEDFKAPVHHHALNHHLFIPIYRDHKLYDRLINPLRLLFDPIYRDNPIVRSLLLPRIYHEDYYRFNDPNYQFTGYPDAKPLKPLREVVEETRVLENDSVNVKEVEKEQNVLEVSEQNVENN